MIKLMYYVDYVTNNIRIIYYYFVVTIIIISSSYKYKIFISVITQNLYYQVYEFNLPPLQ